MKIKSNRERIVVRSTMVLNERPTKRARRRVTADLPDLFTFPPPPPPLHSSEENGPFREKVGAFLVRHARVTLPSSSLFPSLLTWQIALRVDQAVVLPLDIVEEDVTRTRRSVYCDQCRVVGWSGHPVCRKRYHFIIRSKTQTFCSDGETSFEFQQPQEKQQQQWCNSISATAAEYTADDVEGWVYNQHHDNTHLLHAVIHSNGFAHLLTLNGRQGGSAILAGRHIMDLWDRLCQALSVRKVSVMDVSKKYGMEYRLLHAVIQGRSWYGNWGYEFRSGSYALTQDSYNKAVETISTLHLHPFQFQPRKPRTRLQSVIAFYQSLSNAPFQTVKDLFAFMLSLISKSCSPIATKKFEHGTSNVLCVWTAKDVQHVQQAMIKLLAAVREPSWVSKRALMGALYKSFSPQLLDYALKHLGGQLVANNKVIGACCNPDSTDVEYRLEPLNIGRSELKPNIPSEKQILGDLKFIYESVLHPDTMLSYAPQAIRETVVDAATKLLDCKQFIKDYKPDQLEVEDSSAIHLWCHVELSDHSKDDSVLPPELIVLPLNATLGDLKAEATKAFQEVYAMFKRLEVEELCGYGSIKDSLTAKLVVGTSGSIHLEGKCPAKHGLNRFRMERGIESWIVDCICGTKDDDGERMLACDTCGVWLHTRCAGISNSDKIPAKFVCLRCMSSYRKESQSFDNSVRNVNCVPLTVATCRAKVAAAEGPGVASNLNMTSSVR